MISLVADVDETNSKLRDLKVQLGQFSTIVDSKDVSTGKIIEIQSDFKSAVFVSKINFSYYYKQR